ncbi:ribosome biogenesis GTPase Der [Desulfoscipio geothermicus]|uniref:GTPase Der n=1 Tax=Desulfoscipio geothermicus DSM 3669 TaxID=1121426 RepID=A0A1I6CU35_9FIRM|nr:ribosome biogenesis GTPase Der [Desulfoscipio geothermicus]SFQ96686.1 GTP-binding protein [Desulfoscipio geothermicus DSM 3669]
MARPIVAIVGRPNVGKSTLFNRIVGGRVAIVEDTPGVTRDRLYQDAEWNGRLFTLVDTGGLDYQDDDQMVTHIRKQAELAIAEADLILFVVDARFGLTGTDEDVAKILRSSDKPVILVANKVEDFARVHELYDFFRLGLGEPVPVSAAEGRNTGDLLDMVMEKLPPVVEDGEDDDVIKIAVIGRPNVGKSSLVNAILGEERTIVSDIPGTTRDAIDTYIKRDGKNYLIIDTAGIRRRSKIGLATEKYSVIRSLRAIDRSDIVLMMIDAVEKLTDQDKRIAGYAHEKGRGAVLVVNKWDLVEKDSHTANRYIENLRDGLGFMQYAPVLFVSALTRQRVHRVLELVDYVSEQQNMRIATANLNDLLREAVMYSQPPQDRGRRLKIFYATQSGVKPPTFILFVNEPDIMHFSYLRYLENRLRSAYGFEGTPIKMVMRKR